MRKIFIACFLCLLAGLGLKAQSLANVQAIGNNAGVLVPVPYATITVCLSTATGTPCSPTTTIYQTSSLSGGPTQSNPFQADQNGNAQFWATSGQTYKISVTGSGFSNYSYLWQALSTGSGNNPAGNAGDVQCNSGSSTFSQCGVAVPATVRGSLVVEGPRPYVDVTSLPYGAYGDDVHDDTTAIQSAITAVCNMSKDPGVFPNSRPVVVFPPGTYKYSQPQTPSTASPFTLCSNLVLLGLGSQAGDGQFQSPPQGAYLVYSAGASPNDAPIFPITQQTQITIENMLLQGINQAVWIQSSTQIRLINDYLVTNNTGHANNTPLRISNSFWIWEIGGGLQSSGTVPCGIWSTEAPLGSEASDTGLVFVEGSTIWSCSGVQAVNNYTGTNTLGSFNFDGLFLENTSAALLTVTTTSGNVSLSEVHVNNVGMESFTSAYPIINMNAGSGSFASDITITNSQGTNASEPTIIMNAGRMYSYQITNSPGAVDASGYPLQNGVDSTGTQENISGTTLQNTCAYFCSGSTANPPISLWQSESNGYANIGIDATQGIMLGDGTLNSFSSGFKQNTPETTDVLFAKLLPPTGLSGTPTTGGSIPAGTYTAVVWATTQTSVGNCAVSPYSMGATASATVSGSNDAITWNWTASAASPSSAAGYCLTINNGYTFYVSGGSTTSFSYTTTTGTAIGSFAPASVLGAQHRWTYNALGINTTSPAYNLDVNGSAHAASMKVGSSTQFTALTAMGCGTSTTCSQTANTAPFFVTGGPIALSTGTITITSLPFTSSSSYVCNADDSTGINGIEVTYNSGSSVTFTGTGSDSIRYTCIGN